MRLFTRDADLKIDTPLSVWVGLLIIATAFAMKAAKIGPGEFTAVWEMSVHMFLILIGLTALIPGLLLTWMRATE